MSKTDVAALVLWLMGFAVGGYIAWTTLERLLA